MKVCGVAAAMLQGHSWVPIPSNGPGTPRYDDTDQEFREAIEGGVLKAVIVPTGSTEQHNEHLAMINDTASVTLIAQQAENDERLDPRDHGRLGRGNHGMGGRSSLVLCARGLGWLADHERQPRSTAERVERMSGLTGHRVIVFLQENKTTDFYFPTMAAWGAVLARALGDAITGRSKYRGESDETMTVTITSNGYGTLGDDSATGTITDDDATIAEAQRLWAMVDRPNVMIKVPGTAEGSLAVRTLTSAGMNVNITLLFAIEAHALEHPQSGPRLYALAQYGVGVRRRSVTRLT